MEYCCQFTESKKDTCQHASVQFSTFESKNNEQKHKDIIFPKFSLRSIMTGFYVVHIEVC